ncbi:MAG: hypothetical protein AAGI17_09185 [Planctomycetota bacterium]
MSEPVSVTVRYETSKQLLEEFCIASARDSSEHSPISAGYPGPRKISVTLASLQWLSIQFGAPALVTLLIPATLEERLNAFFLGVFIAYGLIFGANFLLARSGLSRRLQEAETRHYSKYLAERMSPIMQDPVEVRVDDFGVTWKSAGTERRTPWEEVAFAEDFGGTIIISEILGASTIVPASAFATNEDRTRFLEVATDHITKAGGVLRFAAKHDAIDDLRCPSCQYALAGARGSVCPECGERVTAEFIATAIASKNEQPARSFRLWSKK